MAPGAVRHRWAAAGRGEQEVVRLGSGYEFALLLNHDARRDAAFLNLLAGWRVVLWRRRAAARNRHRAGSLSAPNRFPNVRSPTT